MGNTIATITNITAATIKGVLAPYRETDAAKARIVLTLTPWVGAGHTADSIISDVLDAAAEHGIDVPTAFKSTTVGEGLAVARAMHATLTEGITLTDSARRGIATAGLDIVRAGARAGGGVKNLRGILATAIDGTDNGAEIAERVTADADNILEEWRRIRRTRKTVTATPRVDDTTGQIEPDTTADTAADNGTVTAEHTKAVTVSLASVSIVDMLAEIDRRLADGHVLSDVEAATFDAVSIAVAANQGNFADVH